MSYTVLQLLQTVGATIDQDTTLPSGTELLVRVQFAQSAQDDWADYYKWQQLTKKFAPTILYSMASIGMPSNATNKLGSPVYDFSTGVDSPTAYEELNNRNDRFNKLSTDKFAFVDGDSAAGFSIQINPPLASGASIVFDYISRPSSLATVNDTVVCPSRQYMAKRLEYYILRARSDPRFQVVESESKDMLASMIEKEDTPSEGGENRVPNWMTKQNYRPGND